MKVQVSLEFNSIGEAQEALKKLGGNVEATVSAKGSTRDLPHSENVKVSKNLTVAELDEIAEKRGVNVSGLKKDEKIAVLNGESLPEKEVEPEVVEEVAPQQEVAPSFNRDGVIADITGRILGELQALGNDGVAIGKIFEEIYSSLGIAPVKVGQLDDGNLSRVHTAMNAKLSGLKAQQSQAGHTPAGPSFI